MANQRTFLVQGLNLNGVAVGGLASLSFNATYRNVVQSTPDGAFGAEDVDRVGLGVDVSMQCSDVTKAAAILNAAAGTTTFSGKESGAATWHDYTVTGLVSTGMTLNLPKNADGTLSITGRVRFTDGTKAMADMITLTGGGAGAPTLTYPARLYRPFSASFDPDGAAPAIAPLHAESLSLSLAAIVVSDLADDEIGETAVDVAGWQPLQLTLTHRDAKVSAPSHIAAALLGADRGVLTVSLHGRGGAANQALILNNLLFTGCNQQERAEYTEFAMGGASGWKNGATAYDLSATPLFSFA